MVYGTNTKNWLAQQYAAKLGFIGALLTLGSSNAIGTEPSGGSPIYARKPAGWGTASSGSITSSAAQLDIPSGAVLNGCGLYDVLTGTPAYYDQVSIAQQSYSSQGTMTFTCTFAAG